MNLYIPEYQFIKTPLSATRNCQNIKQIEVHFRNLGNNTILIRNPNTTTKKTCRFPFTTGFFFNDELKMTNGAALDAVNDGGDAPSCRICNPAADSAF